MKIDLTGLARPPHTLGIRDNETTVATRVPLWAADFAELSAALSPVHEARIAPWSSKPAFHKKDADAGAFVNAANGQASSRPPALVTPSPDPASLKRERSR